MNPKVDEFLRKADKWQREVVELRKIMLNCGLDEDFKWGKPCYSFQGKNVVIIQGFKKYCALMFFKGYLMPDPDGILVKTGENTVVGRQIRFTDVKEIIDREDILKKHVKQAAEVENDKNNS